MHPAARIELLPEDADQRIVLRVDWPTFKAVLEARGEHHRPRLSYCDGVMELMSHGKSHETTAGILGRLVEIWADHHGLALETTKSWTLLREGKRVAVEPDESWVLGDRPNALLPDLALEVVITHGGIQKLERYARLGVREVWFWIDGQLSVHVLRGERYVRAARSHVLRGLDLAELEKFATHPSPGRAPRLYRKRLERRRR
jgi:Uma2 family endonuclease